MAEDNFENIPESLNLSFNEIFLQNGKYTFLVGAGISMPSPTFLPLASTMKEAFISYMTPSEERDFILGSKPPSQQTTRCHKKDFQNGKASLMEFNQKEVRFEQIISLVEKYLDKNLSFIDYFDEREPNLLHHFLAHAIINGHNVMTTNFDCMVERALSQYGDDASVSPVITEKDFKDYSDPDSAFKSGRRPIYKIHGSKVNYITKEPTEKSLIATMSAIAREGKAKTFSIAPYKISAFHNLLRNRILVVMGYSGGDEFDMIPTLSESPELSTIIWVQHLEGTTFHNARIETLNERFLLDSKNVSNHDSSEKLFGGMLREAKKRGKHVEIYKVYIDTLMLVAQYLFEHLFPSGKTSAMQKIKFRKDKFDLQAYIKKLPSISDIVKYEIACWIYYDINEMKSAERCAKRGLYLSKKKKDFAHQCYQIDFLKWLGQIYRFKQQYVKANKKLIKASKLCRKIKDPIKNAVMLNEIGRTYEHRKGYDKAREYYELALAEISNETDLKNKAVYKNNIANIYLITRHFNLALPLFEEVFQIIQQINDRNDHPDQSGIVFSLLNIATTRFHLGEIAIATQKYLDAIKHAAEEGDLYLKALCLTSLSTMYYELDKFELAMDRSEEALKVYKLLNHTDGEANSLFNIGGIFYSRGLYSIAIEKFEESLRKFSELCIKDKQAEVHHWLAGSYFKLGEVKRACDNEQKAFKIATELNIPQKKIYRDYMKFIQAQIN